MLNECPFCKGEGSFWNTTGNWSTPQEDWIDCKHCKGKGYVSLIILCGFCCAGKTYYGSLWAKETGGSHLDLDEIVYQKYKQDFLNINDLLEKKGRLYYHSKEKKILREILRKSHSKNIFLSLGGNTLDSDTLLTIATSPNTKLVWIDTPFDVCWDRIQKDKSKHLSKYSKEECLKFYNERLEYYMQADLRRECLTYNELISPDIYLEHTLNRKNRSGSCMKYVEITERYEDKENLDKRTK